MKKVKDKLEAQYKKDDIDMVIGNRMSWSKYNKMRLSQSFETREEALLRTTTKGIIERRHGVTTENLAIDKEALLQEANQWSPDQHINWSEVGNKYGLTCHNRGQVIKEFLSGHGIAVAQKRQRGNIARRKRLKLPGGEISQPTHPTVKEEKQILQERVNSGQYMEGIAIEPKQFECFHVNRTMNEVEQHQTTVHARLIPLDEIRERILRHTSMGIVRICKVDIENLSNEELKTYLCSIGEHNETNDMEQNQLLAIKHMSTRHFKIWHDHSSIAGHSHLLVMIAAIYDPAFYLTSEEVRSNMDIPKIVEEPEVHILGMSGSSEHEQALFNEHRLDQIRNAKPLCTPNGKRIYDVIRIFHGDNPAQQYETGNKIGGNHPCTMCHTPASQFDDLAFCFKADDVSLAQRQSFLLSGCMWKEQKQKPLEKLSVVQLRKELKFRGMEVNGKLKPELERDLANLCKGIANFPALLQPCPDTALECLNLGDYEVSGVEPLHDFKGHMSNLLEELPFHVVGKAYEELAVIKKSVLGKSTLRCVDYRKAAILVSQAFRKADVRVEADIKILVDTAVEICEIMYSQDNMRTQRNILRLHNITFLHGRLCVTLFSNPKSISQRKMFGTYFHSITCHSAQLYRTINLRSLNTEHQERTFNQINSISQQTSNRHPQHVIDNAVIRIQAEKGVNGLMRDVTKTQESEVSKLASTWQHPGNTTFTSTYIDSHSLLFQAHLERICDFLLPGHGVWWKHTATGIEFLDGPGEKNGHPEGPSLQHYRSCKMENLFHNNS